MSLPRIGRNASQIDIETIRPRETPPPSTGFKDVLRQGAQVLLSGAQVATGMIGLPALSAAISNARPGSDVSGPVASSSDPADPLRAASSQKYGEDLKLLELQDQIQRQNRQISLVSNVMKARHETSKSAIGNIRA
ncbi:MAG: hypothetical protein IT371_02075 [Deltaproteobacteria bacterium]|nr:hypothetical protein [Deltaproteobacteria bacterium]